MKSRSRNGWWIRVGAGLLCMGMMAGSVYHLTAANREYAREKKTHLELLEYQPQPEKIPAADGGEASVVNESLLELQKLNPDVAGWVSVPGTQIEYPVLWAEDYQKYLRADIYQEPSIAGAIFLDYRFGREMAGFQSILYGHNMKNGSMFGELSNYRDRSFYQENREACLYLPYDTIRLELVSCMVVKATKREIYGVADSDQRKELFLRALAEQNVHGEESTPADLSIEGRYVLLSTCSSDYNEARTVVAFRVIEAPGVNEGDL